MGDYQEALDELDRAEELLRKAFKRIEAAHDEGVRAWEAKENIYEAIDAVKELKSTTELMWEIWEAQDEV